MEVLHPHCAGLDIHKDTVVACVRHMVDGAVKREVRTFKTTTKDLMALSEWLSAEGCTDVAMEATGIYWKPVWHILADGDFKLMLANAAHVKNVPGRKTDVNDATWLADLMAHGLIRGSFVPDEPTQEMRNFLRTRKQFVRERTSHVQRIQKTLEDANIKLDSVITDIMGLSGRATTLVKLLNTYFSEMTAAIHARNGIIDKFVGDGLMAFWTAPFSRGESHATDACLAALAQQRAIRELREHLSDVLGLRRDLPEFSVRMGLATGDLVVGTIGSTEARSFTVIGDTVNLASRLEGANKAYETSILVDEATFQLAQNDVESREIDFLAVLGRLEPVRVYEIIAPAGCLSVAEQQLCGLFAEGLAAYRARDWDQSERCFAQCLAVMPTDGPATVFHRRIKLLRGKTLPTDWDGVWQLTDK
jgi:class 3 adenylate cyclase